MDYRIALFIHVISMAAWFGGLAVMAVWLRKAIANHESGLSMTKSLEFVHNLHVRMMLPTAVLVLIAGLYLLFGQGGAGGQTWLLVKERFGTLFLLVYIIGLPIWGSKVLKKAKATSDTQAMVPLVKRYIHVLNLTVLVIAFIILTATIKF
jgi:putative membrane protein